MIGTLGPCPEYPAEMADAPASVMALMETFKTVSIGAGKSEVISSFFFNPRKTSEKQLLGRL